MKRAIQLAMIGLLSVAIPNLVAGQPAQSAIPAGTRIDVELTSTLSSSANQKGDPFTATTEDPVFAGGEEVIPAGSTLHGHVTFVKPPGRVKGKSEMRLVADNIITKNGQEYSFTGYLASDNYSDSGKVVGNEGTVQGQGKSKKKAAEQSGIGAAAGAGIGAMAAGGPGALYGAGIGALALGLHSLLKHHKNLVLKPGTDLTFVLSTPATAAKAKPGDNTSPPFICANCR